MTTLKEFLAKKLKQSKIFKYLPSDIQEKILVCNEKYLYRTFKKYLNKLKQISEQLKPVTREDCFDRYYINDYIEQNKHYIKGDVLEFAGGDIVYAEKYGNNPNIKIMTADKHKDIYPNADYFVDLENIKTLPEDKFDCIIATQVIMYMKDVVKTLENLKYMLKPNGVLILTVPGPLFHHSKNSHHMFSFTEESIKYLCQKVFNNYENFQYYGNLEYTQYMLYWMKKNHYWGEDDNEYLYTLVMGITAKNITK